ncbi:MAG: HEAT repeat domain-containing protein, partial [Myxococcales bacterium]|nr:HEAT repeat domain-containing protein [Myxococcales bacterium]
MAVSIADFESKELKPEELADLLSSSELAPEVVFKTHLWDGRQPVRRNASAALRLGMKVPAGMADSLIPVAAKDADPVVRANVVGAVPSLEMSLARQFETVFAAFVDHTETVRSAADEAVDRLIETGQAESVPFLVNGLSDRRGIVRAVAQDRLVRLGEMAAGALIDVLGSENADLRAQAYGALQKLGDSAVPGLVAALAGHMQRALVVKLIVQRPALEKGERKVLEAQLEGADDSLRGMIEKVLREVGTHQPKLPPAPLEIENVGEDLFADSQLEPLIDLGLPRLVSVLGDGRIAVRANAAAALAVVLEKAKEPERGLARAGLAALIKDGSADVRLRAARALAVMGSGEVIRPLLDTLSDPDMEVCETGRQGLAKMVPGAAADLIHAVSPSDPVFVQDEVADLVATGKAKAAQAISTLLEDCDSPFTQQFAARVAGRIGDPKASAGLIQLLSADSPDSRTAAAEALGLLGDSNETVLDALRNARASSKKELRRAATLSLMRLAGQRLPGEDPVGPPVVDVDGFYDQVLEPEAFKKAKIPPEALVAALADGRTLVRGNAVLACGLAGERVAGRLGAVLAATKDESALVRARAVGA